jgi:lipoprotein-releasing system permease protein
VLFLHLFRHLILSARAGALVRRIAGLSAAGITISVSAFLLILFVMSGMNRSIERRVIALEPHVVLTMTGAPSAELVEKSPVLKDLRERDDLRIAYFESQDVILRSLEGSFQGAVAKGLDPVALRDFSQELKRLHMENAESTTSSGEEASGHSSADPVDLWSAEDELLEGEAMVGIDLARGLGLFEGDLILVIPPEGLLLPPGETPPTERLRVKKVVSTNLADLDSQLFIYSRGEALRNLRTSAARRSGMEIRLKDGMNADAFKKSLGDRPGFVIESWTERNSDLFFALRLEKLMIGTFLALAGLVAGSSVLTVMVLLLAQKKQDIALLRVLGLSSRETVKTFTQLGLLLAGGAIVVGTIIGLGAGLWIERWPLKVLPDIYYDAEIPARVEFSLALWTFVIALILAFLGAWIPSRTVSGLQPSDVLRKKN